MVEALTDNGDVDAAREEDAFPEQLYVAAAGALYALRDHLIGDAADPTVTSAVCGCGQVRVPIDVVEGVVECVVPPTGVDPHTGRPVGYEPSGTTEMLWDMQQSGWCVRLVGTWM